ncbi:hypothetical protein ACHAWF_001410 [Thalassiosira exigua]
MQPSTIGNWLCAASSAIVLAYTAAAILLAKPGLGFFDDEWVEHGFCVINRDVPYWNSHDLCLYCDVALVAIGFLVRKSLGGGVARAAPAMERADEVMRSSLLGHLGHGIGHGFIAAKMRSDNNIEGVELGLDGSDPGWQMARAILGPGFWCGLLKGVVPSSMSGRQLVALSVAVDYVGRSYVPKNLGFGYVNAVLALVSACKSATIPEEEKGYSYAAFSAVGLVLSIIPWIEAMACQSVASKLGGHLIFDVAIPVGVTAAYVASWRHYSGKGKEAKVL